MKKITYITYALPVLALFLGIGAQVLANDRISLPSAGDEASVEETAHIPKYTAVTGKVMEITDADNRKVVRIHSEEQGEIDFIAGENSIYVDENGPGDIDSIETDITLTCYYAPPLAAIMVYPPQYEALVFVQTGAGINIKVDCFNEDLVSGDNTLKLNNTEDTVIIDMQGNAYTETITGQDLIVYYTVSTRSIPAQTNPAKIIVLSGEQFGISHTGSEPVEAVHPLYLLSEDEIQMLNNQMAETLKDAVIIVNGGEITAPAPYVNDQGTVMLPLRAIADALAFEIGWDAEAGAITLGLGSLISFTLGEDSYIMDGNGSGPMQYGAAPENKDGNTFVPLLFVQDAMNCGAMITDGQVIISTQ